MSTFYARLRISKLILITNVAWGDGPIFRNALIAVDVIGHKKHSHQDKKLEHLKKSGWNQMT
jgi:hypothetical protein